MNKRQDEVTAGTVPTYPPGAPVWVMNYPDRRPAIIRSSFHQLSAGPCVVVEYPDGTIRRHPQDKVRPRAEKKAKPSA